MNRRSPRVVRSARMPRRGAPPGDLSSHTVMPISMPAIHRKNAAVSQVQAIQVRCMAAPLAATAGASHAAECETLGDVIAHKIDDEGAGNNGQGAGGGQQTQLVSRAARR